MRERSTWNREAIAKFAAAIKKAEDPRAMNQDHLKEQPAADKYVIGDPSDFAEDVAPSNWKAEYSGGEVKRNEIGMPEMRGETFNHSEKTAAEQEEESEEFLEKKADVCLNIARKMLPKTASESVIEDQAVALMHLPNTALIETATRLAADEEKEEEKAQDKAQEEKAQDKQAQDGQLPDFIKEKKEESDEKKQAGEVPPQFLDHMKEKKEDGDDKAQDKQAQDQAQEDKAQDKQANGDFQMLSQQMVQAFQQGNMQMAQQAIQQMLSQAMQQQQAPAAAPQAPMANDDQLLDQMLQQQDPVMASASPSLDGFDLQGSAMDVGEVKLASEEDEALRALFASHQEVQAASAASSLQGGVRTASTRTVGTRPSGGVSQLGGSVSDSSGGGDIEKLSSLWQSAPDVKDAF